MASIPYQRLSGINNGSASGASSGYPLTGTSKATVTSPADGVVEITNNAASSSQAYLWLGTGAGSVRLKSDQFNGHVDPGYLAVRNSGDTGYANITFQNCLGQGTIQLTNAANNSFSFQNGGSGNLQGGLIIYSAGKLGIIGNGDATGGNNVAARGQLAFFSPFGSKTSAYTVNPATDSNAVFDTTGSSAQVVFTLPATSALNQGFTFSVVNANANGLQLRAAAGDVIQFPGSASSSGGSQSTTGVGAGVTLVLTTVGTWYTLGGPGGSWTAA